MKPSDPVSAPRQPAAHGTALARARGALGRRFGSGGRAGRFLVEWGLMFLLLPPLLLWLHHQPGVTQLNNALYERVLSWQAPTPSPDLLIVAIDARSLREIGPWPWPRSVHARLLEHVAPHAPASVLLDLFLDTATPEDESLAQAMKAVPVHLPVRLVDAQPPEGEAAAVVLSEPVPSLAAQARGTGHVSVTPDADGMVRQLKLWQGPQGDARPYVGLDWAPTAGSPSDRRRVVGIPFSGPPGSYPAVPYVSVLRNEVPPELLRGRHLLVGAMPDSGLGDEVMVSLAGRSARLSGVEFHANAITALQQGRTLRLLGDGALWVWVAFPVWLALLLFLRLPRHALAVMTLMLAAGLGLSALLLAGAQVWLPPVVSMVGLVLAYVLWSWRRLNALLHFLSQRIEALNAVPVGSFELQPAGTEGIDTVERQTRALDRAVERLTQLQSLLSEGLWLVPAAVLLCRNDGQVLQSNAAARRLLVSGQTDADAGAAASLLDVADPLAGGNLLQLLRGLPQSVELVTEEELGPPGPWREAANREYTTPQGMVLRLRSAAIQGGGETAPLRVVKLLDLTPQRRAQRERARWLGFLSHDLRSPQVTILNLLTLHAARAPASDPHARDAAIRREAERTLSLTEGFVDLIEAESTEYRFADIDAGAVVLDAIEQATPMAQLRGIVLRVPVPSEHDALVHADGALLQRALFNLISNALRHSAQGGAVRICLEVDSGSPGERPQVLMAVSDDGSGMSALQLAQLMSAQSEPLHTAAQVADAHSVRRRGIGFTVVQAVVQRHGGWLDASSAPGMGSTFVIGIPALVLED